ncbi:MAG: TonB-dependent receptor plug domain-containing protein [Parasphingopyxis sp.]|uniref:TonB-dependent receptor plug domain-containing protein n=1 Tax=Parasphingopyxis sp. TaxID=1920299 RepID=UPI003F9FFD0B
MQTKYLKSANGEKMRTSVRILMVGTALSAVALANPAFSQTNTGTQLPQTEPSNPTGVSDSADADAGNGQPIVVTGSRLIRRDLIAPSPVTTVDAEAIAQSGDVTLEATLNEFPQLTPDTTSNTNQSGGTGVLSVDLRSLGAVRTLVLVDGRRFIPADVTGLTDLATIPDLLIDRVEIITGGASAVYGSDAIAGAVNFVLRRDFEGVEARYQYRTTERDDGETHKADLLLGVNAPDGRGNLTAYGSYTTRNAVFAGNRQFSRIPLLADSTGTLQPFGSGNIPGGLIGLNSAFFPQIQGVDLVGAQATCPGPIQGIRFGPNGEPLPFCRPEDQFNYAAPNFLLRPLERYQFAAIGHYELGDRIEAYAQFFYTNKENAFQQAPEAVSPTSFGQRSGTILIPNADTNPLYPQPLRDFFAANRGFFDADGDGIFTINSVGRRFEEFGPRNVSIGADSFGGTLGLRGDFDLIGENPWRWDLFGQYQRSDVSIVRQNLLSKSRTTLGLDVVVVNGQPQCRIDLLGCVPVNIFGTATLTPEMAEFLSVNTRTDDRFTRSVVGASVAGDVFELPAGPVSAAFGMEYRDETFRTVPDETALSGDLAATAIPPIINNGSFNLFELFGEVRIPILEGLPAIESLAIEGALRYSNYSTIDEVFTYKLGIDWEITDWIRVRSSYSRAIRAPNLDELFAPPQAGFTGGVDPCVAANNPTAAQRQLCLAQGVPAAILPTLDVGASQGFNVLSGGNQNLNEESADSYTIGAVFTPPFANNLSFTIDYFDITVDDAIANVSAQQLVDTCFQTLDESSLACRAITRLPTGNIDQVAAPLLNVASRKVRGIDFTAGWRIDLPDAISLFDGGSNLDLRLVATWQLEDSTVPFEGLATVECAGFYGGPCSSDSVRLTPDFRAFFSAVYSSGPLELRTEVKHIGDFDLSTLAFPNENGTIEPETYVDIFGSVEVIEEFQLFAGVSNLFDNQPPVIGFRAGGDTNTNVQLYDVLGRQFFFGARLSF